MKPAPPSPSFWQATRFWLKLGLISFGGPAGQIAIMQRELVELRRWIAPQRFGHALNYCMLLPGPEAQQLATYIGWLLHGTRGALAAGVLFVMPGLLLIVALSALIMTHGHLPALQGVLWGLNAAVAALVVHAVWRLGSKVLLQPLSSLQLKPNRKPVAVFIALAAIGFAASITRSLHFIAVLAGAAAVGVWLGWGAVPASKEASQASRANAGYVLDHDTPPPPHAQVGSAKLAIVIGSAFVLWAVPLIAILVWRGWSDVYSQMAVLFSKAAMVTFGGAYAVLPYVTTAATQDHQWLSAAQMMHGLALGETTPGPLILVLSYVGFVAAWTQAPLGAQALLLAGVLGAWIAAWFTFLPSFAFILAGGPYVERSRSSLRLAAPLAAMSAAIVGVMGSLAYLFVATNLENSSAVNWLGLQWNLGIASVVLSVAAYVALHRFQQSAATLVTVCAVIGWAIAG